MQWKGIAQLKTESEVMSPGEEIDLGEGVLISPCVARLVLEEPDY